MKKEYFSFLFPKRSLIYVKLVQLESRNIRENNINQLFYSLNYPVAVRGD